MAFWGAIIAAAKAAAAAAAKAAAVAGKGVLTAGSKAIGLAGKGAQAIGHAAMKGGSKAIAFGKDVGQGVMGKSPTANVASLGKVGVKPNLGQSIGLSMNQLGRQIGQNAVNKTPLGGQGGIDLTGSSSVPIGGARFSGIEQVAQTPNQSLLSRMTSKIGGMMDNPLQSQAPIQTTDTEFQDIVPPQIDPMSAPAPTMGGQTRGMPISQLTPADIEYIRRMRMMQEQGSM